MYDQRDTNGTELRAVAGNFLFSTGANEFAGRYTAGHFDIPVMRTTIAVDDTVVVRDGVLQDVFGLVGLDRTARFGSRVSDDPTLPVNSDLGSRFGMTKIQHRRSRQPRWPAGDECLQPLARDRPRCRGSRSRGSPCRVFSPIWPSRMLRSTISGAA